MTKRNIDFDEKIWDAIRAYLSHHANRDIKEVDLNSNTFEFFNGDSKRFEKGLLNITNHFIEKENCPMTWDLDEEELFTFLSTIREVFFYFVIRLNNLEKPAAELAEALLNIDNGNPSTNKENVPKPNTDNENNNNDIDNDDKIVITFDSFVSNNSNSPYDGKIIDARKIKNKKDNYTKKTPLDKKNDTDKEKDALLNKKQNFPNKKYF